MTILDLIGDLAVARRGLGGAVGNDIPVVILMPNGEKFEVQSGGWSAGGHSSFLNDKGKLDVRAHAVLTIRQAHPPGGKLHNLTQEDYEKIDTEEGDPK